MNLIESLEWRYATKKFDEKRILSEEQINTLTTAFNLTATSYGLQPIKLVVIQNKDTQEKLVPHSWNQQQVAQASHVLVICIQDSINQQDIETYFDLVKKTRNTPDNILTPFKEYLIEAITTKSDSELNLWMKHQAYIALGNLLTVAAVEQIDSCPMEGFIPEKYDEILNLKKLNLKSALVLPVGYRAQDDYMKDLKKVRKDSSDVIINMR